MNAERRGSDHAPTLAVSLDAGETLTVEAGSVVDYTGGLTIDRQEPSTLRAIATRGGIPSVSLATVRAETGSGVVRLAPPLPGTIVRQDVAQAPLSVVQTGSFLAAGDAVDIDSARERGSAFVRGEGLFMLRLGGLGPVFLAGYGGVDRLDLGPGDSRTVNTGYVVAFDDRLTYDVDRVDGMKSTVFGDAGLVYDFEGPGTVWTQTRSHDAFLSWLAPHLPD
jgi:uncharacterized protein (TIGR00266 family)